MLALNYGKYSLNEHHSHGVFIDPHCWVVAAEVFPSHLRAQGTSIAIALVTLADVLWLQLAPTAARTIGWRYYLVFIALGIVHTIYFWFWLPEVNVAPKKSIL